MPDQIMVDRANEDENHRRWKAQLSARLNLPNTSTSEFQAEARRQAAILRGAAEEAEALDFIEAASDTDGGDAIVDDE